MGEGYKLFSTITLYCCIAKVENLVEKFLFATSETLATAGALR
jgi:hypothetical protein